MCLVLWLVCVRGLRFGVAFVALLVCCVCARRLFRWCVLLCGVVVVDVCTIRVLCVCLFGVLIVVVCRVCLKLYGFVVVCVLCVLWLNWFSGVFLCCVIVAGFVRCVLCRVWLCVLVLVGYVVVV